MSCWYPTLTIYFPLGENATQATPYLCSCSSATCRHSETSQIRTAGMWPHCGGVTRRRRRIKEKEIWDQPVNNNTLAHGDSQHWTFTNFCDTDAFCCFISSVVFLWMDYLFHVRNFCWFNRMMFEIHPVKNQIQSFIQRLHRVTETEIAVMFYSEHAQISQGHADHLSDPGTPGQIWTRLTSPVTIYLPSGENANVVIAFLKTRRRVSLFGCHWLAGRLYMGSSKPITYWHIKETGADWLSFYLELLKIWCCLFLRGFNRTTTHLHTNMYAS